MTSKHMYHEIYPYTWAPGVDAGSVQAPHKVLLSSNTHRRPLQEAALSFTLDVTHVITLLDKCLLLTLQMKELGFVEENEPH